MGAMRDAKLYGSRLRLIKSGHELNRIDRSLRLKTNAEQVDFPRPATWENILVALRSLPPNDNFTQYVRAYLLIWWFTTARPKDALLLQWLNIVSMRIIGHHRVTSVKFVEGKGPTVRGPYTVHTILPDACNWNSLPRKGPYLFPEELREEISNRASAAIKIAHRELEMRSIRRGSLQEMAMAGASDEVLMSFSGHKCVTTLHRYLDWGMFRGAAQVQGAHAVIGAWQQMINALSYDGPALANC